MPGKGEAIAKFSEKLDKLEKKLGCAFEIAYPKFSEAVEANRLFADWFEPGTVIARAVKGNTIVTYDIAGELDAQLIDPDGQVTKTFSGRFRPIKEDIVTINNDKDLSALYDGTDPSGCRLMFAGGNKLRISVHSEYVEPIFAEDPSIARGILNEEFLRILFGEAEMAAADAEALLPAALRDAGAANEEDAEEDAPLLAPEADMPEEEEQAGSDESSDEKPASPVKKTKKAAKEPKRSAKKNEPAEEEEPVGRFDLMPLDLVGEFLMEMESAPDIDFLKDIEAFKNGRRTLLEVAMSYAKGYYAEATDAVMDLAVTFEKDAAANGEDAWKDKDARHFINVAIRSYLEYLKEGVGIDDHIRKVLYALFCGAWVSEH